jgi:hypothetical protein
MGRVPTLAERARRRGLILRWLVTGSQVLGAMKRRTTAGAAVRARISTASLRSRACLKAKGGWVEEDTTALPGVLTGSQRATLFSFRP